MGSPTCVSQKINQRNKATGNNKVSRWGMRWAAMKPLGWAYLRQVGGWINLKLQQKPVKGDAFPGPYPCLPVGSGVDQTFPKAGGL